MKCRKGNMHVGYYAVPENIHTPHPRKVFVLPNPSPQEIPV